MRGLMIHRHKKINLFLAPDVAIFVGANGVPGRQSGNVRWKQIFARDWNAHLENAAEKNCIGTLRTGTIDRRNLNTHVVDDAFLPCTPGIVAGRYIHGGHSYPSSGERNRPPLVDGLYRHYTAA